MIASPLNNKVILVVDDESELREAISFDLKKRGCTVYEAANGTEAFEVVKKHKIDIVISDVRMPNGDGIFLLKKFEKFFKKSPLFYLLRALLI